MSVKAPRIQVPSRLPLDAKANTRSNRGNVPLCTPNVIEPKRVLTIGAFFSSFFAYLFWILLGLYALTVTTKLMWWIP